MTAQTFCAILFHICLASCISGLLIHRPLKLWPAERWIDHPILAIRAASRVSLFVSCVLAPLSLVYIFGAVAGHLLSSVVEVGTLALMLRATVFVVPPVLAYVVYRLLVREVRSRNPLAKESGPNPALNRTRRYGASSIRAPVAAGRLA